MKNFVDCHWLKKNLHDPSLVLLDCRFDLFDPTYGQKAYDQGHINGAFYLDINTDLSGKPKKHGGARPIPDMIHLVKKLEGYGLQMDSTIVCYDDETYSSARAWWQLKRLGFNNVYILDGGYRLWAKNEFPSTSQPAKAKKKGKIIVDTRKPIYCTVEYVKCAVHNPNAILIDSREERRFTGEYEPLYAQKGHIPNSINIHWKKNMAENGQLEPFQTIKENFSHLEASSEIITYCGSGIDGAINFAILDELGFDAKLYVGSVSDWISYEDTHLVTSIGE